jgi:RND family efflux transporter MFP subunit
MNPTTTTPGKSPGKSLVPPKKNRTALWVACATVAVLAFLGIAPRLKASQKLDQEVHTQATQLPVVSVTTLHKTSDAGDLILPSTIQAIQEASISARTNGYLKQRFVDIGSHVKAGELLATIEAPEVDQQLSQVQADTSRYIANGRQAQANVSSLQAAVSASESQIASSEAGLQQVIADVAHTKAKLIEAEGAESEAKAQLQQSQQHLEAKKADLGRANARKTLAQKTYVRWQALAKGGAVSGQDLDEAEEAYQSSQSQVEGAQADVASADADVAAARSTIDARKGDVSAAFADIASAQQKVDAARSAVSSSRSNSVAARAAVQAGIANVGAAQSAIASSEANVSRVSSLQSFEKVVAPFSGVITARNVDVGDLISPPTGGSSGTDQTNPVGGTGLFDIARTDFLRIQVNVPESDIVGIHEGEPAGVEVSAYPGKWFTGEVFHTAGAIDSASRTELVEIRLANPGNLLKPGMFAQVRFSQAGSAKAVQIPATAMIFDAKGTRVAEVAEDDTIHFVPVQLGRDLGDKIEVLVGLKGDEQLITNPDDSLREGEKVQIAPEQN